MTYETIEDFTETLGDLYDVDAIEFDYKNNNFDLTYPEVWPYYTPQIVANSVINGQFKQAKKQLKSYGFDSSLLLEFLNSDQLSKIS